VGIREFRSHKQPELLIVGDHFIVKSDYHLIICSDGDVEQRKWNKNVLVLYMFFLALQ